MQLEQLSGADIEKEMQDITEQIRDTKQEIDELVEENKSIAQQLSEYQQKDAKCRILIERYETLISQYKADLQRLDFIAKGEKAVQGMPSNNVCPFCGGDLHQEEDDSYMEAIHSCLKRIVIPIPLEALAIILYHKLFLFQNAIYRCPSFIQIINTVLYFIPLFLHTFNGSCNDSKFRSDPTNFSIRFVNEQLEALGKKKVAELEKKKNPPLYHPKDEFKELVGLNFTIKSCSVTVCV